MKIAFVPLDDRPCCLQFVERLAELGGVSLVTPPRPLLGRFLVPGQSVALREWYREHARACDVAIVSLDMLAFGGLVASRRADPPHSLFPLDGPPVLAFQSILRTAPTQTTPAEVAWANELLSLAHAPEEAAARTRDPERLSAYLALRQRNHALNRAAIEAVATGQLQGLLLGIDDSKTRGWNVNEVAELEKLGAGLPVWVTPGTDESAQLLLARVAARHRQVEPVWSLPGLSERVTAYEDRPLGALLEAQLRAADLHAGPGPRRLWLHGLLGPQAEARDQTPHDVSVEVTATTVVADVAYANGGDLSLLEALRKQDLLGYSGWNTAGNTVGTALACLALAEPGPLARRFLLERLADDGYYQASLRQSIQATLGSPGLTLDAAQLERARALLRERLPHLSATGIELDFPWGRLFEISASIP